MKTKSTLTGFVRVAMLAAALFCTTAKAADEELFDLNTLCVKGELYIWNRISDVFDLFRCGIAGGADIGVDAAVTKYAQLGAMVTKERGVDFPHFLPPLWLTQYYAQKPILNTHEGYCATAAFGPWRAEKIDPLEGNTYFPRHDWDLRLEAAILAHVYVDVSAEEIGDFLAGFVGWDPSGDDEKVDQAAVRRPADQFGRGVCNILFGAIEIPKNLMRVNDEEGNLAGLSKGFGLGVWRFVVREVVGVVEFVTFPFGWTPIIEPEYVLQESYNTNWSVKRPSFHKRY